MPGNDEHKGLGKKWTGWVCQLLFSTIWFKQGLRMYLGNGHSEKNFNLPDHS